MAASPTYDLTLKAYDTYPPLKATLTDANGAIGLSGASQVRVLMKSTTTPIRVLVTGVMTVASAAGGYVTYAWATGDTAVADVYNVEFEIAWSFGGLETVPNDIYRQILITPDLEGA